MDLLGSFGVPLINASSPDSRLARNRLTARMRRERKKKEAELLTQARGDRVAFQNKLKDKMRTISEEEKVKFEAFKRNETGSMTPSGCLFCEKSFSLTEEELESEVGNKLVKHYLSEHPHESKAAESYLGQFMHLVREPKALLQLVISLGNENYGSPTDCEMHLNSSELSPEAKREKRLARNAESARLCRQRKKLYIQRLRLELPIIEKENALLARFLRHEEKSACVDSKCIPKLSGWDPSRRKRPAVGVLPQASFKKEQLLSKDPANLQSLLELNATLNSILMPYNNLISKLEKMHPIKYKSENDIVEAAVALTTLAKKA